MSVVIKMGDQVVGSPIQVDDVMKRPASKRRVSEGLGLVVSVNDPNKGAVELSTYESNRETSKNTRDCKYDFGVSVNGNDCKVVTKTNEKKVKEESETPTVDSGVKSSTEQVESEAPAKVETTTESTETATTTKSSSEGKDFVTQKEEAKADAAIELGKGTKAKKGSKSTTKEKVVEKEPKVETKETAAAVTDDSSSDDDKYSEFEDMVPKIRTKRNGPARDANGRFISTKKKTIIDDYDEDDGRPAKKKPKNKTKSNFIPAKD